MPSLVIKSGALLSLSIVLAAVWFKYTELVANREQLDLVLRAMQTFEEVNSRRLPPTRPRIAVGLGGCLDTAVSALELLRALNVTPTPMAILEDDSEEESRLETLEQLESTFSFFFREGAAAERYVHNSSFFSHLLSVLSKMEGTSYMLGGNAPVMASRFAQEGCDVLLGAKVSKKQKEMLHANVEFMEGKTNQDDVHLLMEYQTGEQWGEHVAPRANRFIIHNDQDNPILGSLEEFTHRMVAFNPDLLVISGLQMMDMFPFPTGLRKKRLQVLQTCLSKISPRTRIHFEMASFVDEGLMQELTQTVLPFVDSIGLNEQELPNLVSSLETGQITTLSSSSPRIAEMLDQIRRVWKVLDSTPMPADGKRRVSRIHLHTLAYQIIMVRSASKKQAHLPRWTNTRLAAAKSSLVAHRHVCAGEIDVERSKLLMDESFSKFPRADSPRIPFNSTEPVACWQETGVEICVAPVLVCTQVKRTAGGGDNISAAGLVPQLMDEDIKRP